MSNTINHQLPYIEASQAQKHVTHNEALRKLDMIVQARVKVRDLTSPPVSPVEGDSYIVPQGATGTWADFADHLAAFQDGVWMFQPLKPGYVVWVEDEDALAVWDGAGWLDYAPATGMTETAAKLGINATADATNKLVVSSPAVLFNHEGAGIQHKLNKNATGDTASVLFQTNWSGRAEFGLTGDDDFRLKVSADGQNFATALQVGKANGILRQPLVPVFCCVGVIESGADLPLRFDQIYVNNGGFFDNSTGKFTVPVSGIYEFSYSLASAWAFAGSFKVQIYKNDAVLCPETTFITATASHYDYAVNTLMLDLAANDEIDIRVSIAGALYSSPYNGLSAFSGRLVG